MNLSPLSPTTYKARASTIDKTEEIIRAFEFDTHDVSRTFYDQVKSKNALRLVSLYGSGFSQICNLKGKKKLCKGNESDYLYTDDDFKNAKEKLEKCSDLIIEGVQPLENTSLAMASHVTIFDLIDILELNLRLKLTQGEAAALVHEYACIEGHGNTTSINVDKLLTSLKRLADRLRNEDKAKRKYIRDKAEEARLSRLRALSPNKDEPRRIVTSEDLNKATAKISNACKNLFKANNLFFRTLCNSELNQNGSLTASSLKDFVKQNLCIRLSIEEAVSIIQFCDKLNVGSISIAYFLKQIKLLGLSRKCDFSHFIIFEKEFDENTAHQNSTASCENINNNNAISKPFIACTSNIQQEILKTITDRSNHSSAAADVMNKSITLLEADNANPCYKPNNFLGALEMFLKVTKNNKDDNEDNDITESSSYNDTHESRLLKPLNRLLIDNAFSNYKDDHTLNSHKNYQDHIMNELRFSTGNSTGSTSTGIIPTTSMASKSNLNRPRNKNINESSKKVSFAVGDSNSIPSKPLLKPIVLQSKPAARGDTLLHSHVATTVSHKGIQVSGGSSQILRARTPVCLSRPVIASDSAYIKLHYLSNMCNLPLDEKNYKLRYEFRWRYLHNLIVSLKTIRCSISSFLLRLKDRCQVSETNILDASSHIGFWINREKFTSAISSFLTDFSTRDLNIMFSTLDHRKRGGISTYELSALLNCFHSAVGHEDDPHAYMQSSLHSSGPQIAQLLLSNIQMELRKDGLNTVDKTSDIPRDIVENVMCSICTSQESEITMSLLLQKLFERMKLEELKFFNSSEFSIGKRKLEYLCVNEMKLIEYISQYPEVKKLLDLQYNHAITAMKVKY